MFCGLWNYTWPSISMGMRRKWQSDFLSYRILANLLVLSSFALLWLIVLISHSCQVFFSIGKISPKNFSLEKYFLLFCSKWCHFLTADRNELSWHCTKMFSSRCLCTHPRLVHKQKTLLSATFSNVHKWTWLVLNQGWISGQRELGGWQYSFSKTQWKSAVETNGNLIWAAVMA